jgi:uncharacterized membrane protein YeiH
VRYLLEALLGAVIVIALVWGRGDRHPGARAEMLMLYVDAAALGLFSVAGATRAVNAGLTFLPALILGVVTAVGGGALRDVLSGRTPNVFVYGEPYAIVAALSGLVFLGALHAGVQQPTATALGCLTGFVLRVATLQLGWRTKAIRRGVRS